MTDTDLARDRLLDLINDADHVTKLAEGALSRLQGDDPPQALRCLLEAVQPVDAIKVRLAKAMVAVNKAVHPKEKA